MKTCLDNSAETVHRILLLLASVMLLLSVAWQASAQEKVDNRPPDSTREVGKRFFVPSMSPSLSYIAPFPASSELSLVDRAMITPDGFPNVYTDAWRRSFILGASFYRPNFLQPRQITPRKTTFFQSMQAIIGVAELAGAAYLGYKAIKKEPITKKK